MENTAISTLFSQIQDSHLPARQSTELVQFSQSDAFFHLASLKASRVAILRSHFSDRHLTRVILGANINGFDCKLPGCTVEYLSKDFFIDNQTRTLEQKCNYLADSVVIVNNNDVGQAQAAYAEVYGHCEKTIFVAWDWDNHHWLDLSTFLAAHSDIYAPGHHENLYLLSRYNWATVGPVYCSTVQWSRNFLTSNIPLMLTASRSNAPLGMHIPYAPFTYRNRVISTLSQHYPSVGFSSRSFHVRTPEERLQEWCGHKLHWIAPVLNDVAIRIFDALITGGIPMVPASMQFLPPVNSICRQHIVFYSPNDIPNPSPLVDKAIALFEAGNIDGIMVRHRYALNHHHGDQRMADILGFVREQFLT